MQDNSKDQPKSDDQIKAAILKWWFNSNASPFSTVATWLDGSYKNHMESITPLSPTISVASPVQSPPGRKERLPPNLRPADLVPEYLQSPPESPIKPNYWR